MSCFFKVLFIVFGVLFLHSGCTKNVPGPQGDPGVQGAPGKMGNMKLSSLTFAATTWTVGDIGWESSFRVTEITDNVIAGGEAEIYMQVGEKWWTLPYGVGELFMQASIEKGWVHFSYFTIHGDLPEKPDSINFRVVVLEPVE